VIVINTKQQMKKPQPTAPHFNSFREFTAHIKGRDWKYIRGVYLYEDAPEWKRLSDPLSIYQDALHQFSLFQQGQATPLSPPCRQQLPAMFEAIKADVASREVWGNLERL
jgi:hypothetical protein